MNGTGTQTSNGSNVAVQHVTVNRGTLKLAGGTVSFSGKASHGR